MYCRLYSLRTEADDDITLTSSSPNELHYSFHIFAISLEAACLFVGSPNLRRL